MVAGGARLRKRETEDRETRREEELKMNKNDKERIFK